MDFETFATGVPIYDGTSPYQNIPFQFSLHVITKPGAMVEHYEFLAEGKDDPRPAFLAELKRISDRRATSWFIMKRLKKAG